MQITDDDVDVEVKSIIVICAKCVLFIPLVYRVSHVTGRMSRLVQHRDRSVDRVLSVKFVWVNKTMAGRRWLVEDLRSLEEADVAAARRLAKGEDPAKGIFDILTYVTRPEKGTSLENTEVARAALANGVRKGRPDWKGLFSQWEAEEYRPGDQVGVFFCGLPSLGKILQQHCVGMTHTGSTRWVFKKENF